MSEALDIRIEVNRTWKTIDFAVEKGGAAYPEYEGPYEVTPALYWQQRLATRKRSMEEDVLVGSIPISEVSNPQGGITVLIG